MDTSVWYALVDADDPGSAPAKAFVPQALRKYRRLVSTNHVVGESYTLIRSRLGHDLAWRFLQRIRSSPRFRSVFVSKEQENRAYDLLERYRDQSFSFVDGISFIIMKEYGISDCFTFDRHFAAAGFTCYPS